MDTIAIRSSPRNWARWVLSILAILSTDGRVRLEGRAGFAAGAVVVSSRQGTDVAVLFQQGEDGVDILHRLARSAHGSVGVTAREFLHIPLRDPPHEPAGGRDPWVGVHDGVDLAGMRLEVVHEPDGTNHAFAIHVGPAVGALHFTSGPAE